MRKKRRKQNQKKILADWLRGCIGSLGAQQQNFAMNPAFPYNVRMANIGLIQNEMDRLRKLLKKIEILMEVV